MTKRQKLAKIAQRSPIQALAMILAGEFDGLPEAEEVKRIMFSKKRKKR